MVIGHILIYEWIYLLSGVFILGALAVSRAVSIWTAECNGVIRHIIGTIT